MFLFLTTCGAAPPAQHVQPQTPPAAALVVPVDSDGDGVPDRCDHCPREPGVNSAEHIYGRGCPWIDAFVGEHDALYEIHIRFDRGDATVHQSLAAAAREMQKQPADRFFVIGHASSDEPDPDVLAMRRAESVAAALVAEGVGSSQLALRSAGTTHPEWDDKRNIDLKASRRVTFDLFRDHARQRAWDEARKEVDYVLPEDLPCQ